jgi:hypothetical protein
MTTKIAVIEIGYVGIPCLALLADIEDTISLGYREDSNQRAGK